jgi:hypothetical protein
VDVAELKWPLIVLFSRDGLVVRERECFLDFCLATGGPSLGRLFLATVGSFLTWRPLPKPPVVGEKVGAGGGVGTKLDPTLL